MKLSIRGKAHWIVVHKNVYYAPRVGVNLIGVPNSPERPLLGGGAPMRNLPATQRTAREKHPNDLFVLHCQVSCKPRVQVRLARIATAITHLQNLQMSLWLTGTFRIQATPNRW
jgi:hypothetical protein